MLVSALKCIHLHDHFMRIVLTCNSLNMACYLAMDNILWLHSIGLVKLTKRRAIEFSDWSYKFWLYSTLLSLARDLHDYLGLLQAANVSPPSSSSDPTLKYKLDQASGAYKSTGTSTSVQNRRSDRRRLFFSYLRLIFAKLRLVLLNRSNVSLHLDTIKNAFDLCLPLSGLRFVNLSPGVQGLCGLVSSLISLLVVWDARFKLYP